MVSLVTTSMHIPFVAYSKEVGVLSEEKLWTFLTPSCGPGGVYVTLIHTVDPSAMHGISDHYFVMFDILA